jgi:hypothetical protein
MSEEEEIVTKPKRPAVVTFGRFEPPTTGHARLVEFLRFEAGRRQATPIVFPSPTHDPNRNPIPFTEKVKFLRQLFPGLAVSGNKALRTPIDALVMLKRMGFDAVWFIVGSDRAAEFQALGKYVPFKEYGILTVPMVRDPNHVALSPDDVGGMSGTKLRTAAQQDDWQTFRAGIPTKNNKVARQIYDSVRKHLGCSTRSNNARLATEKPGAVPRTLKKSLSESARGGPSLLLVSTHFDRARHNSRPISFNE